MDQNNWIDFKLVKQAVSMQMVLDHYGINHLRKKDDEMRGPCPIHGGEGARSFHVSFTKNSFQCFSCKAKGNVLDLVAALEGCSVRDAAIKLRDWFAVEQRAASDKAPAKAGAWADKAKPAGPINPPLSFKLRVDHENDYGLSRGVSIETIHYFGVGLCLSKGLFSRRYVIPLHSDQGQLVGYAGHSLDDAEPKYLFPSSSKGFYKSHLLFNLYRVLKDMPTAKRVVIVEGFFSTMRIAEAGFACVSLLGSSLSEVQEEMICDHFDSAVILMDGDDAGRAATDECLRRLSRRIWTRAVSLPPDAQPDDLPTPEIASILAALF